MPPWANLAEWTSFWAAEMDVAGWSPCHVHTSAPCSASLSIRHPNWPNWQNNSKLVLNYFKHSTKKFTNELVFCILQNTDDKNLLKLTLHNSGSVWSGCSKSSQVETKRNKKVMLLSVFFHWVLCVKWCDLLAFTFTFQSMRCCDHVLPEAWQRRRLHKEVLESESLETRKITGLLINLLLRSLD